MSEMQNNYLKETEVIKNAILQGQFEAAKAENRIQLALYFSIGKYVSQNSRTGKWGTGAIKTISDNLRKLLPGLRGFSAESLKKMRQFYEEWQILEKTNATHYAQIENSNSVIAITELEENTETTEIDIYNTMILPNEKDFPAKEFLSVPFTHHSRILSKTKELKERYYYICRCANEHLSVENLIKIIDSGAYSNQSEIVNNFSNTMLSANDARKAVMMFKDNYLLDFINIEEIGERDKKDIDERVVEQQIIHNIKKFIMTFGHDFAFVGNQYHLEVFGEELFPDLLFFNRELNALVVVELKIGEFKTSYLGQLSAYLRILDDKVKKPHENPSIGIVLCKTMNKQFAEYVIQDYKKPMGVATYKTLEDMPEKLRKALPDIKEMQKLLNEDGSSNAKAI